MGCCVFIFVVKLVKGFFMSSLKENVNRESRKFESRDTDYIEKKAWLEQIFCIYYVQL